MPGNQRSPYNAHRYASAAKRRRDILDLYVQHPSWTVRQLGEAVGLSASRASVVLHDALKQAAADEQDLAAVALARSVKLLQAQMEAAWEVVAQLCGKCHGTGSMPREDEHGQPLRTLANDGTISQATEACNLCEYASGYAYPYQARLGAIDRHGKALEQLNKLLRLYEPDVTNINFNFRSDLAGLPASELDRMLAEYQAPYTKPVAALPPAPEQEVA